MFHEELIFFIRKKKPRKKLKLISTQTKKPQTSDLMNIFHLHQNINNYNILRTAQISLQVISPVNIKTMLGKMFN